MPEIIVVSTPSTRPTPWAGYTTKSPGAKSSFSAFLGAAGMTGAGASCFTDFCTGAGAGFWAALGAGVTFTAVFPCIVTLTAVAVFLTGMDFAVVAAGAFLPFALALVIFAICPLRFAPEKI